MTHSHMHAFQMFYLASLVKDAINGDNMLFVFPVIGKDTLLSALAKKNKVATDKSFQCKWLWWHFLFRKLEVSGVANAEHQQNTT